MRVEANGVDIESGERFAGAAFIVGGIMERVAVLSLDGRPDLTLGVSSDGTLVRAEASVRLGLRGMLSPNARGRARQNLRYVAGLALCALSLWREFKGDPVPAGKYGWAAEVVEDCIRIDCHPALNHIAIAIYEDEHVRNLVRALVLLAGGSLWAWCEGFGCRELVDVEREGIRLDEGGGEG